MNDNSEPYSDLFHKLWAGALFDIISAAHKECHHPSKDEQREMVYQIVRHPASRYEPIDADPPVSQ